ncbi:hypothetical protein [Rhodoblastus sp.]|uniref:hypothetical protein n=1 Tax=Rhodoblastus sp. TaxID=1962975 RepID=UPI003F9A78F5
MSSKTFLTIISVIAIVFGVAFVLVPYTLADVYSVQPSPATAMDARFFGSALLAWGLISWLAREFEGEPLRAVLIGSVAGHAIGAVVTVNGVLSGVMNGLAWMNVLIYLFGAAGCLYFIATGSHKAVNAQTR